ncbi:MAG: carbohydrate-binding domain-containing protein, partial [Lachnospiraceae bacterium]|nr:carbohydrate-binding domain-containing protein [Lachnospiraceae bacterium]
MSTHKRIDIICVVILICTVVITILFMNGEKLGITAIIDEDAESYEGNAYFTSNDQDGDWESATSVYITLEGDTAKISGNGAYVSDGNVYISGGGYYILSGTLDDGSIIVDAYSSSKIWIMLNGVDITCSDSAAIIVNQADKVFLTLAEGTQNTLTDGAEYSDEAIEEGINAAVFTHDDLTINGSGSLVINGNYKHGIRAKDSLVI